MHTTFLRIGIVILLVTIIGCECEREGESTDFHVLFPTANQVQSQDFTSDEGKIQIIVTFFNPPDCDSVEHLSNTILYFPNGYKAPITIDCDQGALSITITTVEDHGTIRTNSGHGDDDLPFTLRLLGSGPKPILNTDGHRLDGDWDFRQGGTYETSFILIS